MKNRRIGTVVAAVMSAGLVGITATSAMAAGRDGVLNNGELAFYYNSGCVNSLSDFATAKPDLDGYVYLSNGAGKGQTVKNNVTNPVWP